MSTMSGHNDRVDLSYPCEHVTATTKRTVHHPLAGCEECLKMGSEWVHLRVCLTCGHVGCCDDSLNKHATAHFHATHHPVMASGEVGENWAWCYVDNAMLSAG